jgi:quaternary ammonium compound-resistance protein SugE
MAWVYLLIAGIFEMAWVVAMKHCQGIKLSLPLLIVIFSMLASIFFMWLATKTIPLNVAYAVWTGIGIIGIFFYGVFFLKEPYSMLNIIFSMMILIGIVGLKLSTK